MLFSEIVTHDLSRPLKTRLAFRRVVGPYRWTPREPGQTLGFYLAAGCGRTAPPVCDPHGSPFRLRLQWARTERGWLGPGHSWGDAEPWFGIIAELHGIHDRRNGDREGRWLAGATLGPGMWAFLEPEVYASPEYAAKHADWLAAQAARQEWLNTPDDNGED